MKAAKLIVFRAPSAETSWNTQNNRKLAFASNHFMQL